MNQPRKRPNRSLRTNLIIWFLLTSVAPLAFLTGYSVVKFERAIDEELFKRLEGNAREVNTTFKDFLSLIKQRRDRYLVDPSLLYYLSTENQKNLQNFSAVALRSDIATNLTIFNRNGRMLVSVFRDNKQEVRQLVLPANNAVYMSDENLADLKKHKERSIIEHSNPDKMSLILLSTVQNNSGKVLGFLEQVIDLDKAFLESLKNRLKLELFFLRKSGEVMVGTHPDFFAHKPEFFSKYVQPDSNAFYEMVIRGEPYLFLTYPIEWGSSQFYTGMGVSKATTKSVLQNVKYTFYSVVGAVILILIVLIFFISKAVLGPLDDLVAATQQLKDAERPLQIPLKSDTEIGLLTESFNDLSKNVVTARTELKSKIEELEKANQDLKDAQSQLVHNSKMVSLGQLVAGVAHELNNPIGFIYSNMTQLREYAGRLIELAELAEKEPGRLKEAKERLDISYVKEDLPKLISSCEEGARRTRDIVLGLRNFSRLEEAKLKEIDVHEALDNTLGLLAGEIKGRIQVHKFYGDLPAISCFASQINQVFMNLLSNAVQAIDSEGNIWITTKVISKKGAEFAAISIQDSGHGIPKEVLDKIFDPFFSTKEIGKGTGLGLSITYGIIQKHGGDITVKSESNKGTEFVIEIPIHQKG